MRKIVCEEEMADYILFGVRLDGQEHKYMVLDQKRGLIFTMIVKNDSVVISTAISGTKDIIWYDEKDTLLVIEKDGAVHETTEKEHPRFARKTQN